LQKNLIVINKKNNIYTVSRSSS